MTIRFLQRFLIIGSVSLMVSCVMLKNVSNADKGAREIRALFLGNSYTDQIQGTFKEMLAASPYTNSTFTFVLEGGATLQRLIDNGKAMKAIHQQEWDYVVLQEQSVRPAIPGESREAFYKSVGELVEEVRKVGAEPVLYMTWGRRDPVKELGGLFPDYAAMQKELSLAYTEAGRANNIRVAPVGDAWSLVRERDNDLGLKLYAGDGSHPSVKGAFLASCVFFRVLFDDPLEQVTAPEGFSEQESRLIREAVKSLNLTESK